MSECLDVLCLAAQYVSNKIAEEDGSRSLVGQNLGIFAFRVGRPLMAPIEPNVFLTEQVDWIQELDVLGTTIKFHLKDERFLYAENFSPRVLSSSKYGGTCSA